MRLLLDTHAFLFWLLEDSRLSRVASTALTDPANHLYLNSVSGLEIAVKAGIGKLTLPTDVETFITNGMRAGQVEELPITLRHTYEMSRLPMLHRDPFDRLLIASALAEGIPLLTNDQDIRRYSLTTIW